MTSGDITTILTRLAVIESKVDEGRTDSARVRRLELLVFGILCSWGADIAGIPTPFS